MTKVLARRSWVAIFALVSATLSAGGYWYYRAEVDEIYEQKHDELAAICTLKAQQIQQWRKERLADATIFAGDQFITSALGAIDAGAADPTLRSQLLTYLDKQRAGYGGLLVLDSTGAIVSATGQDASGLGPASRRAVTAALAGPGAVLSDLFLEADGTVHVDAVAAVRNASGEALGVTILRATAQDYLLPLIQSWPTSSRSAEATVVQRDGGDVIVLNQVRTGSTGALRMRIPLTDPSRPVVQAVLGHRGWTTGVDYRGVAVVASVQPIDGSPWFIVAKMDAADILAEAWRRALLIGIVVWSLILLAAASTAYLYRQRQAGVFRDLYESERRRREDIADAERALRESVERFDLAARATFNVIWDLDLRTNRVWRNGNFEALFGYGAEEVMPDCTEWTRKVLHPDDALRVEANWKAAIESDADSWSDAYRYKRKDGSYAAIEDRCLIVRDAAGKAIRMVGAMQDVTQDAQAQGVSRLQSAALNAAANGIVITDRTGIIVWINPAFTRLTGYSSEEAVGRNPRELVRSGVHDATLYEELWTTILAGDVWSGEMTNRRKDGTLYTERQTITPVKGPDGQVLHFISIKQDLSDEKRLEAQFLQSQKMEVVGRLAGGVAHDFNNLLTIINMTADLAAENLRHGDPLREDFAEIRHAGERAAGLTRQLLAFSRKQILKPGVIDLGALAQDMSGMLQRLIGEDVHLAVTSPHDLGRVKADPGQIEQVIMNLVVNARDAMPDGGKLTIEARDVLIDESSLDAHPGMHAGPHVMVAVSDTGSGMDAATRARIFEPFFTTKEPGKGTGLGLSTVYGIVKQSGGGVWVYSEPGCGTTFKIYLPRISEPLQATTATPAPAARTGIETILVVEDEAPLRKLATRMLRSAGYTVLEAANADAALLVLQRHEQPVHLLLTDVVMPGLNGRELATQLAGTRPEMKVLYTSGYTDDAILRHGVLGDGARFIGKPYSKAGLLAKVRCLLDGGCREAVSPPDIRTPPVEFPAESVLCDGGPAVATSGPVNRL
jgi:two-component system cell cycle sensor histidine kinase/response regulator CckA